MNVSPDENSLPADNAAKINALRDMIVNAERTIQSAKAMLLQLEGKKKTGRPKKIETDGDGTVVEGTFDGQIMMGTDGKQYPVPANYASKSKLVEGDLLKLTITSDGSFIYKQISPIDRKHALGIVSQDESGNYHVVVDGEPFRVLLASITYFRVEPGDEVAVVMPRNLESSWVAIENVLQKGSLNANIPTPKKTPREAKALHEDWKKDLTLDEEPPKETPLSTPSPIPTAPSSSSPLDEWMRDMEALEQEVAAKS